VRWLIKDDSGFPERFLKMVAADADHWKALHVLLWAPMCRLIASSRSATDLKTPRRIYRRVIGEKNPSTALSHDADMGVKWNVHSQGENSHNAVDGQP
jgi:hypothetical protein